MFRHRGQIFRRVERSYQEHYDWLMSSGLYEQLRDQRLLVEHTEENATAAELDGAYKILRPETVPFISYPYEWCFSQLKDAALVTLRVAALALECEMTLKDASAYNIQFFQGRPVFIDTISFQKYVAGEPWVAYRQFCEHFLAPLAIMASKDLRCSAWLQCHIHGIPLDLACKLLPWHSALNPSLAMHVFAHARAQTKYAGKSFKVPQGGMPKIALRALIDNLTDCIDGMKLKESKSSWSEYYRDTSYTDESLEGKAEIVQRYLQQVCPSTIWDIGANTGRFSFLAALKAELVVSMDMDALCVEHNYQRCRNEKTRNILPLIVDVTAPSPGIGWDNSERSGLFERGPADMILALALVHHLAIGNNVPFALIAATLARMGKYLIVEFAPKGDSQVQRLLSSRKDIFDRYNETSFVDEFSVFFEIMDRQPIPQSDRVLFLCRRLQP